MYETSNEAQQHYEFHPGERKDRFFRRGAEAFPLWRSKMVYAKIYESYEYMTMIDNVCRTSHIA